MSEFKTWKLDKPWVQMRCGLGEGPSYNPDTNEVRWLDVTARKIHFADAAVGPSSLRTITTEHIIGVAADIDGVPNKLLAAAKEGFASIDRETGQMEWIARIHEVDGEETVRTMRMNDGAVDSQGRLWAGSIQDMQVVPGFPAPVGSLWRFDPDGTAHKMIDGGIAVTNGIAWNHADTVMYYTDSGPRNIYAFDFDAERGTISNQRVFFHWDEEIAGEKGLLDGLAVDEEGCLWSAVYWGYKVIRISPTGQHIGTIELPCPCVPLTGSGGRDSAGGLGIAYAKAFADAGAFVVVADLQPPPADQLDETKAVFVKCDVSIWEDQVAVFQTAAQQSPSNKIDIVVANAGIAGPDVLSGLEDEEPQKPDTKMTDVNLNGLLYTTKLAGWNFKRHHSDPRDGCLILVGSIMGYIDTKSSSVYSATKFGVRGIMCCLRRKANFRINSIAPWFIPTPIMRKDFLDTVREDFRKMDLDLASIPDAVSAVLRIATDRSIHGKNLAIVPRSLSESGFMDLDLDDHFDGSPADKLQRAASSISYGKFGHKIA
ncbi:hypothetical protein FE257_004894 [Aspergillus nanangensis]|uniref:SMP-30/Gluconolactonase/LRE-like region domain-containing protein n=1 Tax=Aspergillus nanangensis TaxID=2582783 RepID=A0AAD4GP26_ASPNN|nr:hypothetical protein FE257_004894 [Aspergillus nanangensis]